MRPIKMTAMLVALASTIACSTTSVDHSSPEASLTSLRIEVPCANPKFNQDTECHWDQTLLQKDDPQWKLKREIVRTFSGKQGTLYEVTLRVRGVMEPKNYSGGEVQQEHFQIGGTPLVDHYNFYTLHVSDPEATYAFNRNQEKVGHYTFAVDYVVTIPVRGGATVTMGAYDLNDVAIANHQHHVISGVPPAPAPFDGQFFQLDVITIKAVK